MAWNNEIHHDYTAPQMAFLLRRSHKEKAIEVQKRIIDKLRSYGISSEYEFDVLKELETKTL